MNLDDLVAAMRREFPGKRLDYEAKAQQYESMTKEMLTFGLKQADNNQIHRNLIPIDYKKLSRTLGYIERGKSDTWLDYFLKTYPLFEVQTKGFKIGKKGQRTMVTSTIPIDILLAGGDDTAIFDSVYSEVSDRDPDLMVPIDVVSLKNFIDDSYFRLKSNNGEQYLNAVSKNQVLAKTILSIANQAQGCIPHYQKISEFGRLYYVSFNLQNQPSQVREAALGSCYKIDINTSVYAWKYDTVCKLLTENSDFTDRQIKNILSYTRELMDSKDRVRRRIARLLYDNEERHSINTAKTILTAIGFGARSTGNSWVTGQRADGSVVFQTTSIGQIITDRSKLKKLFEDPWMVQFINEQNNINEILWLANKTRSDIKNLEILKTNRGLSKNKTIAYLYQQAERELLDMMTEFCSNDGVLLTVHDGFYVRRKPDPYLRILIQDKYPNITIDISRVEPYHARIDQDVIAEEQQHRERINKEELEANDGVLPQKKSNVVKFKTRDATNVETFTTGDDPISANSNPVTANTDYSEVEHLMDYKTYKELKPKISRPDFIKSMKRSSVFISLFSATPTPILFEDTFSKVFILNATRI